MRRFLLAVLGATPLLSGAASAAPLFGETGFTLANGLQVVVIPNHSAPIATQWVWYKAGSADEQRGRSGAAHFLEHLMFRGTKTLKPKEFSEIVARQGGQENAATSWDYTTFHQTVAADRLGLMMRLEADRMQNLVITDAQLEPERQVVLEEWRMRIGNDPASLLDEQVEAALYLNSPYRIPVLGWVDEIKTLDVADERHFYDTWYAPNNAVLIVAGDVTPAEVRSLAEKDYGPIPARPVPARVRSEEPPRSGDVTVRLADPRVEQAQWSRYYLAPSFRTGGDRPYAIQVLADILGGGPASRLYRALVLDQGLATDAGAWYDPARYGLGQFGYYASARPGVTLDRLGAAANEVVAQALKQGITADEVARAKSRLVNSELYAEDSLSRPVEIIGRALTSGQSLAQVDAWPAKIGAVTVAEVNEAAHALLADKPTVTGLLLPVAGAPHQARSFAPPTREIR